MSVSDKNKNRGAHGDSSFMLGGLPSSSENPPAFAVGECHLCFPKDMRDRVLVMAKDYYLGQIDKLNAELEAL